MDGTVTPIHAIHFDSICQSIEISPGWSGATTNLETSKREIFFFRRGLSFAYNSYRQNYPLFVGSLSHLLDVYD